MQMPGLTSARSIAVARWLEIEVRRIALMLALIESVAELPALEEIFVEQ